MFLQLHLFPRPNTFNFNHCSMRPPQKFFLSKHIHHFSSTKTTPLPFFNNQLCSILHSSLPYLSRHTSSFLLYNFIALLLLPPTHVSTVLQDIVGILQAVHIGILYPSMSASVHGWLVAHESHHWSEVLWKRRRRRKN